MQSGSWLLYLVVVAIITIGVALTIWLIIEYDYGAEPRNDIPTGAILRVRSAVIPDAIVGNTNSQNYYMVVPQRTVQPGPPSEYGFGIFTTFQGAPTETFTTTDTYSIMGATPPKYELATSVNLGAGNRYALVPNGSNPNAIPVMNVANQDFSGRDAYQYYVPKQFEEGIEFNVRTGAIGLYAPFLAPILSSNNNSATSIGSSPIYKMLFNRTACVDGIQVAACGSDPNLPEAAANNGKMRVRYAPPDMTSSTGLPNITGLRQYDINEPEMRADGNDILEYLFYVEVLQS